MLTWAELAARTLAKQFPSPDASREPDAVAGLLKAVGPIQSQTARSTFIGLAARRPGVTFDELTEAHESLDVVRGSSLRGTVHTSHADLHPLLEAATRLGQRALWARTLKLSASTLEQVWAGIEAFAADEWRSAPELADHLLDWLATHDPDAGPSFTGTSGRYFAFGHGGLLRRPVNGDWAGQGAPEYRTASTVLDDDERRAPLLAVPDDAVTALVRHQLAAAGPLSRNDLAWWSGLGLTRIDSALAELDAPSEPGPDGRSYHDLPGGPAPASVPGLRLLPEFDALFCAFDPDARERFVDPAHYAVLWKQQNGQLLAPVLLDDRLRGHWRLAGTPRRRSLTVTLYPGVRSPRAGELSDAVAALGAALGIAIAEVQQD